VRWDIANNQLSKSKYGYSAPGVTRVFVAGQGEGSERTIVEVTTPASLLSEAIWGRIERFVDQRNTDDADELTQAGLEVLATEGTTVTSLEVVPSSAMADGFGIDWFLGSWVTVVVNDQQIRAQVVEVPISITSSDGVLVGAVVGDATGFDWQAILAAKQSKTEKRVSALEQNAESGAAPGVNFIINGGFDVWQRGTSFTAISAYSADRWQNYRNGSGTASISREAFTPGSAPVAGYEGSYFMRFNQTVAGTGATGSIIQQHVEDVRSCAGQTVTASFWAKADSPRTLKTSFNQIFGTAGAAAIYDVGVTDHSVTTAWQRFSVSVYMPSISGKTVGPNSYMSMVFNMVLNSTQTFDIWGVQLEQGSVATAFRRNAPSIQAELAACQRYYYRMNAYSTNARFGHVSMISSTVAFAVIPLPVTMRAISSSVEWTGTASNYNIYTTSRFVVNSVSGGGGGTLNSALVVFGVSGAGSGQSGMVDSGTTSSSYLGFSAEL
jgi:hypothetical protein